LSELRIATPAAFEPLLQPSRYKGAFGGRGSAKSHFFAGLVIEESVASKMDVVCIREVQRTLDQSVKKLLELKIQDFNVGSYFEVQDRKILSRHGGQIIFEGMQNHTADSIKSLEGYDRAWVEEAQTLSQRSLDLLRPTIRKEDSELWFSWNPRYADDPVDKLLRGDKPPPGAIVVEANYTANPWFPEVLRKEMEYDRARDPEKYAHVWLGQYEQHSEARVFKNWVVEEFDRPPGTIHRLGADWGYAIDPSVLIRCSIDGKRLYVDHEAYMIGCEIVNLPDLFRRVPESEKWFITADSARPETISHLQKHGFPKINPAIKGARSVEEGVAFLQSFDIVVHPRCQHLIDELTLYKYKTDPLTGKVLPLLEDKNNHCIDALRYACEGARKALRPEMAKPIKYDTRYIV
jgi:phage terminase large subunit